MTEHDFILTIASNMNLAITVKELNQTDSKLVWRLADSQVLQKKTWFQGTITIQSNLEHRIFIEATTSTKHTNFIGKVSSSRLSGFLRIR